MDYIGIAQDLKSALGQYSRDDRKHAGIDEGEAVAVMVEKYEIVADMFYGFDYRSGLIGTAPERLSALAGAFDWVLDMQQRTASRESTEDGKKRAHRRFNDAVLALSKAFALRRRQRRGAGTSATRWGSFRRCGRHSPRARPARASLPPRGTWRYSRSSAAPSCRRKSLIFSKPRGWRRRTSPSSRTSSSPRFRGWRKKNLAMAALRKLINGEIRSQSRVNVVQARAFSERLEEAIARYHGNAITTAEVIQELIQLAKDIRAAHRRGAEEGLVQEEISFYDALARNESAVEVMGNDQLRVIAQELLSHLKSNASVDWQHRVTARARMQVLVKRILRKYGYPPDLQDAAVRTVLQQAEVLSARWAA